MDLKTALFQVGTTVRIEIDGRASHHLITARCVIPARYPVAERLLLRVDPSVPGTAGLNAWLDAARFTLAAREEPYL